MFDLKLLGGLTVENDHRPSSLGSRRHALALLAVLALTPARTTGRLRLIGMLWPDVDEPTGRNRLTSTVYHVRKAVGTGMLISEGDRLRLGDTDLDCDVWRFDACLARDDPEGATREFGGTFLDGFYLDGARAFDMWVETERDGLRRRYRDALEQLARQAEHRGELDRAGHWWRMSLENDPLDSRVARRLVTTMHQVGNRTEARRVADRHARLLGEELGPKHEEAFRAALKGLPPPAAQHAAGPGGASIAVLPFNRLGVDGGSPLAEAIHAGVLTRLSDIAHLRVVARTSVQRFRDTTQPIAEIARTLAVEWVLEGEALVSEEAVQANVRLVDATEERQIWAKVYRRRARAREVFEMEAEIARGIADTLELTLSMEERKQVERRPTESLEAYRWVAQGRMSLEQRSHDAMDRAVSHFERAIDIDPGYGLAWVGLADTLGLLHAYGYREAADVLPRAKRCIERALELAPTLAEAHAAHGRLLGQVHDVVGAERGLLRAVQLKPGYADAHNWLSVHFYLAGRPEAALASARRAVELNPLSPEVVCNLAIAHLINGELDEALAESRRTLELQPSYVSAALFEGITLMCMERTEEGISILDGLSIPWAPSAPVALRAVALAERGDADAARHLLHWIEREASPFDAGLVHLALGATDRAFASFEEVDFHSHDLQYSYWPSLAIRYLFTRQWESVREDPRLRTLQERLDRGWGR